MRRRIGFLFPCLLAVLTACSVPVMPTIQSDMPKPRFILDAGHGGFDGGAVSADGIAEKEINLQITLQLRELLTLSGYEVLLTRETDTDTGDPQAQTIRERKVTDIHNRYELMCAHPDAVFISIHQNYFTESKYSGAQFFHASSDASKALAQCLQEQFRTLQPDNRREIKACGDQVYLIYHATGTAVLAECGFLSNPAEAAALSSTTYQQQVAFALYRGILRYLSVEPDH